MPKAREFECQWVDNLSVRQMRETYWVAQIKSEEARDLLKSMRIRIKWRLERLLKDEVLYQAKVHRTINSILKDFEGFEKLYEESDDVPPKVSHETVEAA